jgi:hypothetical protein
VVFAAQSSQLSEHVSEYGVHWNFIMSLCGMIFLSPVLQISFSAAIALGIIAIDQTLLSLGLQDFILEDPHTDFLATNKKASAAA